MFATAKSISLTSGQLDITSAMTITGPAAGVTLDGNQLDRVVEIEGAGVFAVTISDVSFINGKLGSAPERVCASAMQSSRCCAARS